MPRTRSSSEARRDADARPASGARAGVAARGRRAARRGGLPPASRPADAGQGGPRPSMPGLPCPARSRAGRATDGSRSGGFRHAAVDPRPAGQSVIADVFRQGAGLRRHGRMEEELQAHREAARRRGRLRRRVRRRSRPDITPDEWLSAPSARASTRGSSRSRRNAGRATRSRDSPKGACAKSPGLYRWGSRDWIARMIRKPGAADRYGFLAKQQKMPPFGVDQVSDNDVTMIIRYLRGDYPHAAVASVPAVGPLDAATRRGSLAPAPPRSHRGPDRPVWPARRKCAGRCASRRSGAAQGPGCHPLAVAAAPSAAKSSLALPDPRPGRPPGENQGKRLDFP